MFGRLTIDGLDRTDTAALIGWVLGEPDAQLADVVYERTGGNPFFVQELARLHAAKGGPTLGPPAGVRQVVGRRLARLRQQTHDCLSAAAVLGDDVDVAVLAQVTQLPVATVLDAVDEAAGARLAVLDGAQVLFAHALVREVLYDGVPGIRRGLLHGRAGMAVADHGAASPTVADHFRHAVGLADGVQLAADYALLASQRFATGPLRA